MKHILLITTLLLLSCSSKEIRPPNPVSTIKETEEINFSVGNSPIGNRFSINSEDSLDWKYNNEEINIPDTAKILILKMINRNLKDIELYRKENRLLKDKLLRQDSIFKSFGVWYQKPKGETYKL